MKPSAEITLAILLSFITLIREGFSLKCYVCTECYDPLDVTADNVKVSDGCEACTKNVAITTGAVSRTCYFATKPYQGCQSLTEQNTMTCYCDGKDKCNTASLTMYTYTTILAPVLIQFVTFNNVFL